MLVYIHTYDKEEAENIDNLGLKVKPRIKLNPFYFKDELLDAFWVSEWNKERETKEITFYMFGESFVCDYSKDIFDKFCCILGLAVH